MKKQIQNMADLRLEIRALESLCNIQEAKLRSDFKELGEVLQPGHLLQNAASSLIHSKKKKNPLFTQGVALATGLLAEKVLFRKSSFIVKTLMSFVLKKVATKAVSDKPESIADKVKRMFSFILKPSPVDATNKGTSVIYSGVNKEAIKPKQMI